MLALLVLLLVVQRVVEAVQKTIHSTREVMEEEQANLLAFRKQKIAIDLLSVNQGEDDMDQLEVEVGVLVEELEVEATKHVLPMEIKRLEEEVPVSA